MRTEIDSADFKKENLASKIGKNKAKKPYLNFKKWRPKEKINNTEETIIILEDIATLQPGNNARIAAKKITKKYKNMRTALAEKNKYKLPGEIVKIENVKTD